MLFLIEAAAACGPVAPARLGGGAEVVHAILDVEEQAQDSPVPTQTGLSQPTGAAAGDFELETSDPESASAAAQCRPASVQIA